MGGKACTDRTCPTAAYLSIACAIFAGSIIVSVSLGCANTQPTCVRFLETSRSSNVISVYFDKDSTVSAARTFHWGSTFSHSSFLNSPAPCMPPPTSSPTRTDFSDEDVFEKFTPLRRRAWNPCPSFVDSTTNFKFVLSVNSKRIQIFGWLAILSMHLKAA